ncbi:hypothetical protein niasHT_028450 [Heterodera trifolii]|uniref:BTB domain-containing protein n=1 Tax=Heterodera trifolii TaxID=157864 RepID=A0ABD2KPZ1_9BILA
MSSSKSGNLADRMKHLLSTAKGADAHFLVGDGDEKELLSAHKNILMSTSDVFEAMFRFDSQNAKAGRGKGKKRKKQSKFKCTSTHRTALTSADNPVEVPDIEPEAFRVMLSFIYADDLSELDGDNAMAVLYAAKKYCIDGLVSQCLQIPIPKLSNVFLAFAQTRLFDFEDFARQCLRYICQNADELFESEEFLQIEQKLLCEIFDCDQLVISSEFEIWNAALNWADWKCRQNAIECSAENRRAALGAALFKIRFPHISMEDFTESIVPSGILTNDEFVSIYQFHCHPNLRDVPGLKPLKFPWHGRISDWNISKGNRGTLAMEIEKFSEFSREKVGSRRNSELEVSINGLSWKISAEIKTKEKSTDEKWLGFYLLCTASGKDGNWSCKCSATLRIISQKNGTKDLTGKYDRVFKKEENSWGFPNFITFAELMDPSKGFYDKNEDKVTLAIDFTVGEEKGTTKRKLADA